MSLGLRELSLEIRDIQIKKYLFFYLDKFLPRKIALIPYLVAYKVLKDETIKNPQNECWYRNSCFFGNFVFGLSDIDITIFVEDYNAKNIEGIKNSIKRVKKAYPFLGEVNLYSRNQYLLYLKSLNYFEGNRDPVLIEKVRLDESYNKNVEKIVFLLRAMFSDRRNLLTCPELRQKKWKFHFDELDIIEVSQITYEIIVEKIIVLLEVDKLVQVEIRNMLTFVFSENYNEEKIFNTKLSDYWKFLFPHKYLWFENSNDQDCLKFKNTIFEKICLRQIDWEIWGIMSQLPFINNIENGIEVHMNRFIKVAETFEDSSGFRERISNLINLSKTINL